MGLILFFLSVYLPASSRHSFSEQAIHQLHIFAHTRTCVQYIAKEWPTLALCLLYPDINESGLSLGIPFYNEIRKALVQRWHWNYSNSEVYIAVSFYASKGKMPFSRWKFYRNVKSTMYAGILLWNVCLLREGRQVHSLYNLFPTGFP